MEEKKIRCPNCGASREIQGDFLICPACGDKVFYNKITTEAELLLTVAEDLLYSADFDEAYIKFESIIARFPKCYEAHWGALLAKYGIQFVDDFIEKKKVPTIHNTHIESVLSDMHYKKALSLAPEETRINYKRWADKLEKIRIEWVEKASKEPPYDIFICFKDSDDNGNTTEDSRDASELYAQLSMSGYKVFFSRVSLRDKVSENYEPYIFNALNTAKVMIIYSSKPEYIESTWLKNEWNRYIEKIQSGDKLPNSLVVAYKNMLPSDLPRIFKDKQCLNAGKIGFYTDLTAHIDKILSQANKPMPSLEERNIKVGAIGKKASKIATNTVERIDLGGINVKQVTPTEEASCAMAIKLCERKLFSACIDAMERVLQKNPNNSKAIWWKMLAGIECKTADDLFNRIDKLKSFDEFKIAVERASQDEANYYIKVFKDVAVKLFTEGNIDRGVLVANAVLKYKSKAGDDLIRALNELSVNFLESGKIKESDKIYNILLSYLDSSDVDGYIELHLARAKMAITFQGYAYATDMCVKVLEVEDGNTSALWYTICAKYKYDPKTAKIANIIEFNDFIILEKLLMFCSSVKVSDEYIKRLLSCVVSAINRDNKMKAITLYERFISYLKNPREKIRSLYDIANKTLALGLFDLAEKYYALIVTDDQREFLAYWGLLQAKLKCIDNNALLISDIDFVKTNEFNSAIVAGSKNELFVNTCLDLAERRPAEYAKHLVEMKKIEARELIERKQKRKKQRKTVLYTTLSMLSITTLLTFFLSLIGYNVNILSKQVLIPIITALVFAGGVLALLICLHRYKKLNMAICIILIIITAGAFMIAPIMTYSTSIDGDYDTNSANGGQIFEYHTGGNRSVVTGLKKAPGSKLLLPYKIQDKIAVYPDNFLDSNNSMIGNVTEVVFNGLDMPKNFLLNNSYVKKMTVLNNGIYGNRLTTIGDNALSGTTALKEVNITRTHLKIGDGVFKDATALTTVNFRAEISLGGATFENCTSLETIALTRVDDIPYKTFNNCTALKTISNKNEHGNENGYKTIGSDAFRNCTSLESIYIGSPEVIGDNAFKDCANLTIFTTRDYRNLGANWNPNHRPIINYESDTEIHTSDSGFIYYTTRFNTSVICGYNGNTTDLIIPNQLYGYNVTEIIDNAFYGNTNIQSVTLPSSLKKIGNSAFADCSNIQSITLPDTITSIGDYAFRDCTNLTAFNTNSSLYQIGSYAFEGCAKLEAIFIQDNVYGIGEHAFKDCSSLTIYCKPYAAKNGWDKAWNSSRCKVQWGGEFTSANGEYKFQSSDGLGGITLTKYLGSNTVVTVPSMIDDLEVTSLSNTFYNSKVTKVVLPEGLKSIGDYTFSYCSKLTDIIIPNSVTNIGKSTFNGCTSLTNITIPDNVTSIGDSTFEDCSSLTSIAIPFVGNTKDGTSNTLFGYIFGADSPYNNKNYVLSSLKTVIITGGSSIDDSAFYGCSNLITIKIPNSVTSIGESTFYNCASLVIIELPTSLTSIGNSAFYNCASLVSIELPTSLTSIGNSAFYNCASLVSIELPTSLTSIGNSAFESCSSLTSITIPFIGATKDGTVKTHFSYIFGASSFSYSNSYVPSSLKTVIITSETAIRDSAFRDCTSLVSIEILKGVTIIGNFAFRNCTNLTNITIPDSVTSIGNSAFNVCNSLTNIKIPGNVASIDKHAFRDCSSLISITIPFVGATKDGTANTHFGYIFGATNNGDNITFVPSSLTTVIITGGANIDDDAFYYCNNITSITIPKSITSIGNSAFRDCGKLKNITIPDSVTSIGERAFYDCTDLTSIFLPKSITSMGAFVFYSRDLTIYCEATDKPDSWNGSWAPYVPLAQIHWGQSRPSDMLL